MELLCWAVQIYLIICVVRVVLSWMQVDESGILGSIGTITYLLTEPAFSTVRRAIPTFGDLPIDFSPMIVMIVLGVLRQFFCYFV